jgi:hypothetical protein
MQIESKLNGVQIPRYPRHEGLAKLVNMATSDKATQETVSFEQLEVDCRPELEASQVLANNTCTVTVTTS